MPRRPALPKDPSQRAKALLDMATGAKTDHGAAELTETQKLAAMGGLKGGIARAKVLSPKRRSEIASRAAKTRWTRENE